MDSVTGFSDLSDVFSSSSIFANFGAPFLIGLSIGYFSKKMLRLALLVLGAAISLLFVCEYLGIITTNDEGLQHAVLAVREMTQQSGSFLLNRLSQITCRGLSAGTGFLIGLRMG